MKRNMKQWAADIIANPTQQPIPLLSFPCIQLMNVSVKDVISDSTLQAQGLKAVADRTPSGATVSFMDLSVEAEAFGSDVRFYENEVPTVVGAVVIDEETADALVVPKVGTARTGLYIETIQKAVESITDRPVFSGVIGPFSLAGRLLDVNEIMIQCFEEPDLVHTVLEKTTQFIIQYCNAYIEAGANGVVIAEPLTGLMSPALAEEFSHPYVKKIIDAVQTEEFAVIYHNCGNYVPMMIEEIYQLGAAGYHFGDMIRLADLLPKAPADVLVMGNVSPSAQFKNGTPDTIKEATQTVMRECCSYPNFVISSGCDIPPMSPWENIEAFFQAVKEFSP